MKHSKPKNYEEDWFEPSQIIGTGAYQRIGAVAKPKTKQIGFIRQKVKQEIKRKTK